MTTSPFLHPLAVEAWDTWFRWREAGRLHDLTIETTWDRVASALAAPEPADVRALFKHRLLDAQSQWQLLLDERILGSAGTPNPDWRCDDLVAVLNMARFVLAPCTRRARFDHAALETVAALAVQTLDNAALLSTSGTAPAQGLRIGVIGLADAFTLMGLRYNSVAAHELAALVARELCQGCLTESIRLARDRGPVFHCDDTWQQLARSRGLSNELIGAATRFGLRYRTHTAITSQPRLAWFANHVADALDPVPAGAAASALARAQTRHTSDPDDYASMLYRRCGTAPADIPVPVPASVPAQLQLRAAMQPWIDTAIDYPVQVNRDPHNDVVNTWVALATELGLSEFAWRKNIPESGPTPVDA